MLQRTLLVPSVTRFTSCGFSLQVHGRDTHLVNLMTEGSGKAIFQHWCSTSLVRFIIPYFPLYDISDLVVQAKTWGFHMQTLANKEECHFMIESYVFETIDVECWASVLVLKCSFGHLRVHGNMEKESYSQYIETTMGR